MGVYGTHHTAIVLPSGHHDHTIDKFMQRRQQHILARHGDDALVVTARHEGFAVQNATALAADDGNLYAAMLQ
jgi:hypothetical protein